ncbi:MAG: Ger(x)C family spore germination C-terminal domain-containing protein [Eubacteriales bacterium]|nr:Ger(x)C family spore germination C-terminal domain-containing protein [Eubacteriales bacterium]
MNRKIKALCAGLLCLPLCGCSWRDAGDLSAVTAAAIDSKAGTYQLSAELAVPDPDSATPQAQIVTGQADTIVQAIDNTGFGRSAQLYWSHTRVLFLGQNVLRNGIADEVQDLTVSSEVRPSVRVCAVKNATAAGILTDCISIDGDPAGFALGDSLDHAIQQSQVPDIPLYRVLDCIETDGVDAVLPAVSIKEGQAVLTGAALFSGDALCGWLDEQQTTILCALLSAGDSAIVYDDTARYKLTNIHTAVSANTKEQTAFSIQLRADVACESSGQAKRAASTLRAQCTEVIEQLQRNGCDALGFGQAWERADAASWKQAADTDWQSVPVTVHVTLHATQSAEGGSR